MTQDGIELSANELRRAIEDLTEQAELAVYRLDFEAYDRAYAAMEQAMWLLRDMLKHAEQTYLKEEAA